MILAGLEECLLTLAHPHLLVVPRKVYSSSFDMPGSPGGAHGAFGSVAVNVQYCGQISSAPPPIGWQRSSSPMPEAPKSN